MTLLVLPHWSLSTGKLCEWRQWPPTMNLYIYLHLHQWTISYPALNESTKSKPNRDKRAFLETYSIVTERSGERLIYLPWGRRRSTVYLVPLTWFAFIGLVHSEVNSPTTSTSSPYTPVPQLPFWENSGKKCISCLGCLWFAVVDCPGDCK
jgi:hypothetical protein